MILHFFSIVTLSFSLLSDHLKPFKPLYKNATFRSISHQKPHQYHIYLLLSFPFRFQPIWHCLVMDRVNKMVSERPVVIFSKSSCCMSHTIKTLFCDFGVNPLVHELDEIPRGREIEQALSRLGCSPSVPAVFIGGELVGGANEVMSLHLDRSLIPMLKKAGALWV
ncbi:monothiol glutaredoxin-S2 [Vigna radiata var. radiata]|uniref:Monothiol glutaredoxin-S2 n=1 Tax=Vigna radiata var. radiata TaxID=3916 RepID=A0A1S3UNR4_VIGRR|nr:monothiol glutaredoxin-S2 [Vigna radiata var. radiata]